MNVIQENVDELNAVLKVTVSPDDYKEQYDEALRTARKNVNMPGFRKGMVPKGMVKKMYGRSLLADELNKLLQQTIQDFISNENLDILGSPLPKTDEETGDWDNPADFEFAYEIGLAPSFDLDLSKMSFTHYTIAISDEMLDKQVDDMTRRYGKLSNAEVSEASDMIMGDFVELNEDGEIKEGGIMHQSTVALEFIEDEDTKASLIGKKAGDIVVVDPHKVSKGGADTAAMLGISKEEAEAVTEKFNFRVAEVKHLEPAEVNQEFYDKLFGEGNVNNVEDFHKKVADDMRNMFKRDTERMFQRDVSEQLVKSVEISLPDEFLKRWIQASNEKPVSMEEIVSEYDGYSKGLQWQLIKNKLIGDHDIKIENDEVISYAKGMVASQYAQYGLPAPEDEQLEQHARQTMANEDERRRVIDVLFDHKVMDFVKEQGKFESKEVSYDDFVKLASGEDK